MLRNPQSAVNEGGRSPLALSVLPALGGASAGWGRKHVAADRAFQVELEQRVAALPRPRRRACIKALNQVQFLAERANAHRRAAADRSIGRPTRAAHVIEANYSLALLKVARLRVDLVGIKFEGDDAFEAELQRIATELTGGTDV